MLGLDFLLNGALFGRSSPCKASVWCRRWRS